MNSDLTLRTQLTEFRDHKLIRTRKVNSCFTLEFPALIQCLLNSCVSLTFIPVILQGADGVECLTVAVDANTLTDFLENEEGD